MAEARTDRQLRRLGLLALAIGLVLSGLGIAAWVSLMPIGILVALLAVVLIVTDAAHDVMS